MIVGKIKEQISNVSELQTGDVTIERFVAFLDIMGFKDFVARNDHRVILEKLTTLTDFMSETVGREHGFYFTMFSDSIMVYSDKSDEEAFSIIVYLISEIVRESISIGLPIKGAIAKGVCTATTGEKLLYFGQPIIDAFKLEENLVIYGVAIHNTAEEEAIRLSKKKDFSMVYDYNVPLKSASSNHYIINWYGDNIERTKGMLMEIRKTVSDFPRRYIDNTLKCISFVEETNWKER